MKRKVLMFTLTVFTAFSLVAQIKITPEVGLSISNYRFQETLDEWYDSNPKYSFIAGASIDIPITGGLYFQPRLYYVKKGSFIDSEANQPIDIVDINGETVILYDNYDEELNYFEFPIMLKYQFLGGTYGFQIAGGANFALGLGGQSQFSLTDDKGNSSGAGVIYDDFFDIGGPDDIEFGSANGDTYEAFEIGITGAIGMYIEAGSGQVTLDLRMVYNFTDMYGEDYTDDIKQFNNNLYLTLGYSIPLTGGY